MELSKIEELLEKYFEATTSIEEEKLLQEYFASNDVASHLEPYKSIFGFFANEKQVESMQITVVKNTNQSFKWLSIAASLLIMFGVGFSIFNQDIKSNDLGTYDNPEEAFLATQKALALVSKNVNKGIKSVSYIQEYEETKSIIFQ